MGPRNTRKDAKNLRGFTQRSRRSQRKYQKLSEPDRLPISPYLLILKSSKNLCDLRGLCVINFPHSGAKAGAFAYYARHQLAIVAIAEPFPISGLTIS